MAPNRSNKIDQRVPRVRLAVWYYNDGGTNGKTNNQLMQHLSGCDLGGWKPERAQYDGNQPEIRGKYVPIDVDLVSKMKTTYSTPKETLREIFHDILPIEINNFLERKKKAAHHITVYPLGQDIPDKIKRAYTHFRAEHSLAMRYHVSATTYPVTLGPEDPALVAMIKSIPGAVLDAKDLGPIIGDLVSQMATSDSPMKILPEALKYFGELELPKELSEAIHHEYEGQIQLATPGMQTSWGRIACSTAILRQLSQSLSDGVKRLQDEDEDLSNSDLHFMLTQAQVAVQIFSVHEKEVAELRNAMLEQCGKGRQPLEESRNLKIAASVICILFAFALGPLSWGGAAACASTVVSGKFAYDDQRKVDEFGKKEGSAKNFENQLGALRIALQDAQIALAVRFCTKVLHLSPGLMALTEQRYIMEELGVDPSELNEGWYSHGLLESRLERYTTVFEQTEGLRSKLAEDFGLRETKMAVMQKQASS